MKVKVINLIHQYLQIFKTRRKKTKKFKSDNRNIETAREKRKNTKGLGARKTKSISKLGELTKKEKYQQEK